MKEKYFDVIKRGGIVLAVLTFVLCFMPHGGLIGGSFLSKVGVARVKVTYYRVASKEEMKKADSGVYNDMVAAVTKQYKKENREDPEKKAKLYVEEYYDRIKSQATELFKSFDNWNEAAEEEFVSLMLDSVVATEGRQYISQKDVKELVNSSIVMVKQRKYQNMGESMEAYRYLGKTFKKQVNEQIVHIGENDYYTDLITMSLVFVVFMFWLLKYNKESKLVLGLYLFVSSCIGLWAEICNESKLKVGISEWLPTLDTKGVAHKVSHMWPIIGYTVWSLLIIYAVVVIVVDFWFKRRKGTVA